MFIHTELVSLLAYDPSTGLFIRRVTKGKWKAGDIAGGLSKDGYWRIKIEGKFYQAHRLAWFYVHGAFPSKQIDHRNRNKLDNRISNLREVMQSENMQNQFDAQSRSKSGLRGVFWHQGKWAAKINLNGKRKLLGKFDTQEEAASAYLAAKKLYHPIAFI